MVPKVLDPSRLGSPCVSGARFSFSPSLGIRSAHAELRTTFPRRLYSPGFRSLPGRVLEARQQSASTVGATRCGCGSRTCLRTRWLGFCSCSSFSPFSCTSLHPKSGRCCPAGFVHQPSSFLEKWLWSLEPTQASGRRPPKSWLEEEPVCI